MAYQVERTRSRSPHGQSGDREALRFLLLLDPTRLIDAIEHGVQTGQVSRAQGVSIEEKLPQEINYLGRWK